MPGTFGNYWTVGASALASVSHVAAILALTGHLYGIREGYRRAGPGTARLARWLSLETMLLSGVALVVGGVIVLAGVIFSWTARDFGPTALVLLAIIGGNEARFLSRKSAAAPRAAALPGFPCEQR
jgi:hypothetical protein